MSISTQLLCTFCDEPTLNKTVQQIVDSYDVAFDTIYVLNNLEDNTICCTYNVFTASPTPPPATISLHRKKQTNTLYTINALNMLIEKLNNGVRDKNFEISWEDYTNNILVTAYGELKIIKTELRDIINVGNLDG